MKFATWLEGQRALAGIISKDMQSVHSFESAGLDYDDMNEFIFWHTDNVMAQLRELEKTPGTPVQEVKFIAPIPYPYHDPICLGLNYRDHAEEAEGVNKKMAPEHQGIIYFSKRVVEAVGPGGIIESHTDLVENLDYEAELAVVIGRNARYVSREDAWKHVFGLMCFNDVSGREPQFSHGQWYYGKSLDGFTAYGPYIVTADEFTWPLNLRICSRINGETRQDSNTSNMIHPVDEIISDLSRGITLDPGTIIATGTPAGVGVGFEPKKCMKPGDVCEIEIEGCGILRTTVE